MEKFGAGKIRILDGISINLLKNLLKWCVICPPRCNQSS